MKIMKNEQGYSLLISFFAIILITVMGITLFSITTNSMKTSINERIDQSVYYVAESGINFKMEEIYLLIEEVKPIALKELNDRIETLYNSNKGNPDFTLPDEDLYHFYKTTLNDLIKSRLDLTSNTEKLDNLLTATPEGEIPKIEILIKKTDTPLTYEILSEGFIKNTGSRNLKATFSIEVNKTIFISSLNSMGGGELEIPKNGKGNPPIREDSADDIIPIYTFSRKKVDLKTKNWTINGKENRDASQLRMLTDKNIELLDSAYKFHQNSCSNAPLIKDINLIKDSKNTIHIYEDTTYYIDASTLKNELLDIKVNNSKGKEVNIVYCNVTKFESNNPPIKIEEILESGKKSNTNVFVVSENNMKLNINNLHFSNLITNIFYAPNLSIGNANANKQNICTTFYVDTFEKLNGSGGTLSNACTGTLPHIPSDNDDSTMPSLKVPPYVNLSLREILEI